MKFLFDTSVLVEIDRGNNEAVKLMKGLVSQDHKLFISAVTVAEIMAGAYRNGTPEKARKVLGQFQWKEMKGGTADKTGEIMADLLNQGKLIEFQDVVIASTAEQHQVDKIVTENRKHFKNIKGLKPEIKNTEELKEEIEK